MARRAMGVWLVGGTVLVGCGGGGAGTGAGGAVSIDGSSTVYPITEAVAEEFMAETGGRVRVTVGVSGTGGGFKRFCADETDISNASRHIKQSEVEQCEANGIEYLELPIAYDGLSVVVHPENTFAQCLTVAELRRIWSPGSAVETWADVRPDWPRERIRLYGPGTDSGTFDYFTEVIAGQPGTSRADYTASEDDNVLVQGVSGDRFSLGYFGFAYYEENAARLNLVAVDGGAGCVEPTLQTVQDGTYAPLSRPIFIYVKRAALARPPVAEFVRFYMEHGAALVREVGYIALEPARYRQNLQAVGQTAADGS
jgi:phosphate transport system substrate-binding protein